MSKLLTLTEQYVYTSGACQVFVAAAARVIGGSPEVLVTKDTRHLEQHGYPLDEPLEVHIYLRMPDGSVVDGEGRRSAEQLRKDFGIKRGYSYEVRENQSVDALGKPKAEYVDWLEKRLRQLGWEQEVPEATRDLQKTYLFKQVEREAKSWWPIWQSSGGEVIPGETALRKMPGKEKVATTPEPAPEPEDGNYFHHSAGFPDIIARQLKEHADKGDTAALQKTLDLLGEQRASDGLTPLHVIANRLNGVCGPFYPMETLKLIGELFNQQADHLLSVPDPQGITVAELMAQNMGDGGVGNLDSDTWKKVISIVEHGTLDRGTDAPALKARKPGRL